MMGRHGIETLRAFAAGLAGELSTAGSLFRSGCWALFFFVLVLCVTSPPREPDAKTDSLGARSLPGQGFMKVSLDRYEPLNNREAGPNAFRIAVIGSSEAFDFRSHEYSLGASIFRMAPRFTSVEIEVIEKTKAMLSRREKMQAVKQATALDADLVVVSLPLLQLFQPLEIGEFGEPDSGGLTVDALLVAARTPSGSLNSLLSAVRPDYRTHLARAFRLAPSAASRAAFDLTPHAETVTFIREPPSRVEVRFGMTDLVKQRLAECGYMDAEALAHVLRQLAAPAVESGVPVVLLASPVMKTILDEELLGRVREHAQMLEDASLEFEGTSTILFNGLRFDPVETETFFDLIHLENHDPLASALLESLAKKGVIPVDVSTDEN